MVGGIDPISSDALPAALTRLLDPGDSGDEDVAWREFVGTYSTLLLQVARSTATSRDAAMDTYTFVLEQLREQGVGGCARTLPVMGRASPPG